MPTVTYGPGGSQPGGGNVVSTVPLPPAEEAARDAAITAIGNKKTIEDQAEQALATNTTYLAIGSPSNAQVAAQVRSLTQQNNKIIRLLLNKLDGTG